MNAAVYKPHFEFQKKLIRDRKANEAAKQQHIALIETGEAEQNQAILEQFSAGLKTTDEDHSEERKIDLVMIPTGLAATEPLQQERIDKYRAHLQQVIEEASGYSNADEVPVDQHHTAHDRLAKQDVFLAANPKISRLSDRLCTLCAGGCCSMGEEHAYISAVTIRRLMDSHRELDCEAILQTYIGFIGTEGITGACINQTERGCALPRDLRSDVCNLYFCDEIKQLQSKLEESTEEGEHLTMVVQRTNTHWNRYEASHINPIARVMILTEDDAEEVAWTEKQML